MRYSIVLSLLSLSLSVSAAPKDFKAFLEISKNARAEMKSETSFEKLSQKLKGLEKEINATLEEYEKLDPEEGGIGEEYVAKFSYSLEPAVALATTKKPSEKDCEKAKHQVEFEDKSSREEDALLKEDAQEAIHWIELLCKP